MGDRKEIAVDFTATVKKNDSDVYRAKLEETTRDLSQEDSTLDKLLLGKELSDESTTIQEDEQRKTAEPSENSNHSTLEDKSALDEVPFDEKSQDENKIVQEVEHEETTKRYEHPPFTQKKPKETLEQDAVPFEEKLQDEEENVESYKYKPLSESEKSKRNLKYKRDSFDYKSGAKSKLPTIIEHSISKELSETIDQLKAYISTTTEGTFLNKELREVYNFIDEKIVNSESEITKEELMDIQNKFGDTLLNLANYNVDFEGIEFENTFDLFSKITEQVIQDNEELSQDNLIGAERLENESDQDRAYDNLSVEFSEDDSKRDTVRLSDFDFESSSTENGHNTSDNSTYPDPDIGEYPSDDDDSIAIESPERTETPVSSPPDEQSNENNKNLLESSVDFESSLVEQAKLGGKEKPKFFRTPKALRNLFSSKRLPYTKMENSLGEEEASIASEISDDGSLTFDVESRHEDLFSLQSSNEDSKEPLELQKVPDEVQIQIDLEEIEKKVDAEFENFDGKGEVDEEFEKLKERVYEDSREHIEIEKTFEDRFNQQFCNVEIANDPTEEELLQELQELEQDTLQEANEHSKSISSVKSDHETQNEIPESDNSISQAATEELKALATTTQAPSSRKEKQSSGKRKLANLDQSLTNLLKELSIKDTDLEANRDSKPIDKKDIFTNSERAVRKKVKAKIGQFSKDRLEAKKAQLEREIRVQHSNIATLFRNGAPKEMEQKIAYSNKLTQMSLDVKNLLAKKLLVETGITLKNKKNRRFMI